MNNYPLDFDSQIDDPQDEICEEEAQLLQDLAENKNIEE
jgi:hypothetical protein